jgi:hypothetical protein
VPASSSLLRTRTLRGERRSASAAFRWHPLPRLQRAPVDSSPPPPPRVPCAPEAGRASPASPSSALAPPACAPARWASVALGRPLSLRWASVALGRPPNHAARSGPGRRRRRRGGPLRRAEVSAGTTSYESGSVHGVLKEAG